MLRNLYRYVFPTKVRGTGNSILINSKRKNFVIRIYGNNNQIYIGENCRLRNTNITIIGDNNKILINDYVKFDGPCNIELLNNASLAIASNAGIRGVNFSINNGDVSIGTNCMFSYGITVRNHDAHSIIDEKTGKITNIEKDIRIGNHVWICQNATILKGTEIGDNSIIGFGAIVTGKIPENAIGAGIPAKIVKSGIYWDKHSPSKLLQLRNEAKDIY